ncbi:protein disulfide isomerase [Nosema bombycis CQ1]|uniref:Protein disulfide isomerase n=1 Tax=Nosema bombycis (strain CQ1 / CVCC 102059) TaxID=578461 RepID=R0KQ91_NOSB1|nr:protein disulfide isomerase [Nosema bombycis CQ1]|eukprot:EOB12881.1 protein disulfide isomerase [Nosema bombycis CQ1]
MYEGLNVPFLGQLDLQNLIKFTNRLIEPAFLNLNYNELLSIARDSEPVYVVLHQNENLANETFLRYAHNFKFKTRLFKSEDPEIFKRVGVKYYHGDKKGYYHGDNKGVGNKVDYHGDKKGDYNKGDYHEKGVHHGDKKGYHRGNEKGDHHGEVNHEKGDYHKDLNYDHFPHNNLNLVVFKNGHFHLYDGNVHNEGTLIEWLFHTHFPNVTKISDSTFHSIFNGIKPVFLLLTENDFLTQNLERFARDIHLGKPFYHLIFSSINLDEFMLFTASLLPKIEIPTIVIYNPKDKKFYHKKNNLNEFNFKEVAEETLKLFDQGKLKVYGSKNSWDLLFDWGINCDGGDRMLDKDEKEANNMK